MIVLGLCSICILMLVYLPISLIPVWQTQFHVTTSVADWTSSAYGFAYAIGNVFWGMLSDRIRRVKILYIGTVLAYINDSARRVKPVASVIDSI
ncbi:MFS transporter [Alicyclobacillus acidoterrestris]